METGLQTVNQQRKLSVKTWCRKNGVSEHTYYKWQRRLHDLAQNRQENRFAEITPLAMNRSRIAVAVQLCGVELAIVMLSAFTGAEKAYVCCGYTNLRQGIDSLSALVKLEFDLDPFSNTLFCGWRRDRAKALYWEGTVFVLLYKRLKSDSFQSPRKKAKRVHKHSSSTFTDIIQDVPIMPDMEQRAAAQEFAAYWQRLSDEKQEIQTFWLTLLQKVLDVEDADKLIAFEVPVKLGHVSFINAFISVNRVLIEQKGSDINLRTRAACNIRNFISKLAYPFDQMTQPEHFLHIAKNPTPSG